MHHFSCSILETKLLYIQRSDYPIETNGNAYAAITYNGLALPFGPSRRLRLFHNTLLFSSTGSRYF